MEFQAYVVRAHALRKVFVSVKGFYYQADIQGQAVTWLVPHNLAQASFCHTSLRALLLSAGWHHVGITCLQAKLARAAFVTALLCT